MKKPSTRKSQQLWKEAKRIIPGGSQLLSKRVERFLPEQWPAYFQKAKGIEVIDLDGNIFLDMLNMSVGACVLGYADPDVNKAVKNAIDNGIMTTLNAPEEVVLAKEMLKLNPWAGMVRFARMGGEAMTVAVRIARAKSGKDKVAFCGYHGWHDWYLSTNIVSGDNLNDHLLSGLSPKGVPRGLSETAFPFHYNNIGELEELFAKHDIGTVVMEPMRHQEPQEDFLKKVRALATKHNAVLVFDEITSGFRTAVGGMHKQLGVEPDVVVYAKALGNGFPISAIIGRSEVMDIAQETFISSTHWTERMGFVAALAVIKKMKEKKVPVHIKKIGTQIAKGWYTLAKKHGLNITIEGPMALVTFEWNYGQKLELQTLFTQEMLRRNFLASQSVYVSYAHKDVHVSKYLRAVDEVFAIIKHAIDTDTVKGQLEGPVARPGFARLT